MNINGIGGYGLDRYRNRPALGEAKKAPASETEAEIKALDLRPDLSPRKKETAIIKIIKEGMSADEAILAAELVTGEKGNNPGMTGSFADILKNKMGGAG